MTEPFSSHKADFAASKFEPKEEDWICDDCRCKNAGTMLVCPACQTSKPESVPSEQPTCSFDAGGRSTAPVK